MSIANEITRLQTAKSNIKTSIENKGVAVDSAATLDSYATYVDSIQTGGGSSADTQALKGIINRSITSIDVPSDINKIGAYAFAFCTSLTSIDIPSGVSTIDVNAFEGCTSLSSVTMPNGVTSIAEQTFSNCNSLTNINIPSGVTSIGSGAFSNCRSLTSIDIPSGVTSIGSSAFQNCSGLTSINIPSGVTRIENYTFNGCSSLTSITVNAITPPILYATALANTNNCPIYVPAESVEAYKAASSWNQYVSRIQAIPND